jgi:hypothetical protein
MPGVGVGALVVAAVGKGVAVTVSEGVGVTVGQGAVWGAREPVRVGVIGPAGAFFVVCAGVGVTGFGVPVPDGAGVGETVAVVGAGGSMR